MTDRGPRFYEALAKHDVPPQAAPQDGVAQLRHQGAAVRVMSPDAARVHLFKGGSMTTQPTWSRLDEATADLLTLVADPEHPVGRDAVDAFLAACRRDARANGGVVSVNRVRELLTDAQITARRYSSFWAEYTGPGKPMRVIPDAWEINLDKKGGNGGKPLRLREWVGFDE